MPDRSTWIGYALLVATALGWSGAWITARLAAHEAPALGLVPVFAVAGANVLLGEALTPLHAVGGLLVLVGIVLPGWARSRDAGPREPT